MALVRLNPIERTPAFSNLLENFLGRDMADLNFDSQASLPAVNIQENNEEFRIELAAPGLNKENFRINLDNNNLTISSEMENSSEDSNTKFVRKEFSYSSFKRSFTLPSTVDSEKIKANYKNGVLAISLPKREEAKLKPVREIEVK